MHFSKFWMSSFHSSDWMAPACQHFHPFSLLPQFPLSATRVWNEVWACDIAANKGVQYRSVSLDCFWFYENNEGLVGCRHYYPRMLSSKESWQLLHYIISSRNCVESRMGRRVGSTYHFTKPSWVYCCTSHEHLNSDLIHQSISHEERWTSFPILFLLPNHIRIL